MKKLTRLNRVLLLRKFLMRQYEQYTEAEVNLMICIYEMNEREECCTRKTIFEFLSKIHRTPYKKKLLATIRKFKKDEMIRITKRARVSHIEIGIHGYLFLSRVDSELGKS